jgi:hypothetical protein
VVTKLDDAIRPIARSSAELRDLLGSFLEVGDAYLVGSLAAGFGNARSDIDVHIIGSDIDHTGVPVMFFLGSTIVDVVHHRHAEVDALRASLARSWVPLAGGICGRGATLSRADQKRIGRWWSAVPIADDVPRLLPEQVRDPVTATNARGALSELMLFIAVAEMVERHATDGDVSGGAWRRAARAFLELVVRARGESFVGDKWVWRKARRLDLDPQMLDVVDRVRDGEALRRAMGPPLCRFPAMDLVRVRPEPAESLQVGAREAFLVGDLIVPAGELVGPGSVRQVVDAASAGIVLQALAHRVACLEVDDAALDEVLA